MSHRLSHPVGSGGAAADARRFRHVAVPLIALLLTPKAFAEEPRLEGVVRGNLERPVAKAVVTVDGGSINAVSDQHGSFTLAITPGTHVIHVRHPAYEPLRYQVTLEDQPFLLELRLSPLVAFSETISVSAIRAGEKIPVTKKDLNVDEIGQLDYGQDVPFLLTYTPSMTSYSDSGMGNNYSYFSLRGIHQTRINMTLDGVPLNDPAENALYFSNFTGFTGFIDSIQIQRGVGTSTVGSPSYGGSINFASAQPALEAETDVRVGFGSYGTKRASAGYQSGLFQNGLTFYGRASFNESDGYRERSGVKQRSAFLSAAHLGEGSQLKLTAFSGREQSQLSFLAIDAATLEDNPRFNPLAEEERDSFGQDFAQLRYTRDLSNGKTFATSLYYNGAQGWFRLWDDPVAKEDLLEFSIDGHFIGSLITLSQLKERFEVNYGLHHNNFRRDHFLHIEGRQQYRNTGFKRETNAFVKAGYDLDAWHLFGDAQIRHADFRYQGDINLGAVAWTFFDPKLGARYRLSDSTSFYASVGKASREPTRMDLLAGEDNATVGHDLKAVKPERVVDFEAGIDYHSATLTLATNVYAMEFRNEIAATGELSDIGLPLRRNVDRSYRRGLEIDLHWMPARHWVITHSSNFSRNRIREWTQFYDVFDPAGTFLGSEPRRHRGVPPLLTPEMIINQGVRYERGDVSLSLLGRYVGDAHLDNTANELRAPSYFQLDFRGTLELASWRPLGRPRITLHLKNALDARDLYPSGYSYLFFTRGEDGHDIAGGIPFYYPLAGRNFVVTLDFRL